MDAFSFTKTKIENLPVAQNGRVVYHDAGCPNLILRVSGVSKKFYFYGRINGSPSRLSLGTFPTMSVEQARKAVSRISGAKAEGKDPAAERKARRSEATLKDLFTHWLEVHGKPRKRSWADDQRQFDVYLKDWHSRKLSTIRMADVAAWHARMGRERGPVQANRAKALLCTLFNKSREVGYSGENPCKPVSNFPEKSRERFLLPDEMRAFFMAVEQEEELWRDFFLLCLFTGSRKGNVASMRWAEIDIASGAWYIPSEKTKNKRPGVVALCQPAIVILQQRRELTNGSEWVFPSKCGDKHVIDSKKAWQRILERSGIADLHVHDLRRTMGSWQAAMGANLVTIGKSLGHADLKSTQVYSRLQIDGIKRSVGAAVDSMLQAGGVQVIEVPNKEVQ